MGSEMTERVSMAMLRGCGDVEEQAGGHIIERLVAVPFVSSS
jgi:hypothetical protein